MAQVTTADGQPFYGPIQISLATEGGFGAGSGLAVERFPVASADGEVSYERTFDLSEVMGDLNIEDVVRQHRRLRKTRTHRIKTPVRRRRGSPRAISRKC